MNLSSGLVCCTLNYQRLDENALSNLAKAALENSSDFLLRFKQDLGFKSDTIAVVRKCNAVMIIITYQEDLALEYLSGRILHAWDTLSASGIMGFVKDIKFYEGTHALQYLGECAAGIHSVTIGDSQVLAQLMEGLTKGIHGYSNTLKLIANWLPEVVEECKARTKLLEGNTSLERIASDIIADSVGPQGQCVLLGYGKSGKLVAKILNTEDNLPLVIVNRSPIDVKKRRVERKLCQVQTHHGDTPSQFDCFPYCGY
jgi:glutamyl-tRNA reductase